MVERSRMRLVTALRNGAIDLVIATDGGHVFDSNALPLSSERVLVALPEGHQLAGKKAIYWTDLRNETVLFSSTRLTNSLRKCFISMRAKANPIQTCGPNPNAS